jgi:N-acetyl-gamma-glutamyl-phosphate reductase
MIRTAVVGATGYTGQELVRILARHPSVELSALTSRREAGKAYSQVFPGFRGIVDRKITGHDLSRVCERAELVFLALPHAESQAAVAEVIERKRKAIDLSADFRFKKLKPYRHWYGEHRFPQLLRRAVYGMPEIYREQIKKARLVANPGCYPTSVILALKPLCERRLFEPDSVIVDSKSGLSGAGRSVLSTLMFSEVNESLRPYNIYHHRHTPEMEQELTALYKKKVQVTFAPHLVPLNRGILSTIYVRLVRKMSVERLHGIYQKAYSREPFIRLLAPGELPDLVRVRGSNFCDIGLSLAESGRSAVITSAIDNLIKGASGTAVQNFNLMSGLPETTGLDRIPLFP